MFLTQNKSDVMHSITENIINIDAMIKQIRAIIQPANKNILVILPPYNLLGDKNSA